MSGDFQLRHWQRSSSRQKSLALPSSLRLDPLSPPSPSDNGRYTSLSDLISSSPAAVNGAVNSPSSAKMEIRIRNRLVKQAAHAYLQPTPSTTESSSRRRSRFSLRRALAAFGSCFGFILGLFRTRKQS